MKDTVKEVLTNAGFEDSLVSEFMTYGRQKKSRSGQIIISPEMDSDEIPIVVSGLLKVMRMDENEKEVFLYYLTGGETCAMSITCCLDGIKAEFKVVAEEDSVLWMVPMKSLDSWIVKYPNFRKYVFGSYQLRFDELLQTIDSIVFDRMDGRLYKYLLDTKQATGSYEIQKTHEQIAQELGTSRVVISRIMKKLEHEGKIELGRNRIDIL